MTKTKERVALFILLGQSNAVGHGVPMEEQDKIKVPLKNVFGLSREKNQSFENEQLVWSGYTSGGMNLGESQDHTYSVANCLARLWQDEIDSGNKRNLPDLYIIQIAIGAQGVTENYMWYPDRKKTLIPGELGTVDISLYPFTTHILGMVENSLKIIGKEADMISLHWRGGENDSTVPCDVLHRDLESIYARIFEGFYHALGKKVPVILHYLPFKERSLECDPSGEWLKSMHVTNEVFAKLVRENDNMSLFDSRTATHYVADTRQHGLFLEDAVHYNSQTNKWVALQILESYALQCIASNL